MSRICSSSQGTAAAALVLCPQRQGWSPGQAEPEHQGLVPQSLQADCHEQHSVEQSDCFLCLLQMMITASKDAQMAAAYSQSQVSLRAGRSECLSGGALLSNPVPGAFFTVLFPIWLTTPALPLPTSLLDPSLFHLLRSPLCQIKKVFHVYWALYSFPESEHLAFR